MSHSASLMPACVAWQQCATVTCTCQLKVSKVNKWVLMSLIGGLNNEDTKQVVLSRR